MQFKELLALRREDFITNEGVTAYDLRFAQQEMLNSLLELIQLLSSPEVEEGIKSNRLTLGMIKPRLDEGVRPQGKDELIGDICVNEESVVQDLLLYKAILHKEICPYIQPFAIFSLLIDPDFLAKFYNGRSQTRQRNEPPIDPHRYGNSYETRWDEYTTLMTMWPVTFLLLESASNTASSDWRSIIGKKWKRSDLDLPEHADKLRGRLVLNEHNSLFHGSDSVEDALNEITLIKEYVALLSAYYYSLLH